MLKLPTSLGFLLGKQPTVAGAGSLVKLDIRIFWVEEGYKMQNKAWFSHLGASYILDGMFSMPAMSAIFPVYRHYRL